MISVLYVDDEPELLELGKLFLEQTHELSVDTVISAILALEQLQRKKYDLVLSDYLMPEMDGIRFLQTLRGRGDTIPFIIFTGRGREEVIIDALNSGVDFYLQKGGDPTSQFAELKNIITKSVKQKRSEEAQHQSEKRVYDILNHLPEATFAIDHAGRVIAWNMAIERMTGVKSADILEKGDQEYAIPFYGIRRPLLIDLIDEADTVLADLGYTNVRREGMALIAETSAAHPRGNAMDIWAKVTPVFDDTGDRAGAIETLRDITDRKKADNELVRREEQSRNLLSTMPDIVIVHHEGVIVYVNQAAVDKTGFSREELIGSNLFSYIVPEDRNLAARNMAQRSTGDMVGEYEIGVIAKSGIHHHVIVRSSPIVFNQKPSVVVILVDITGRKMAEMALKESENLYRTIFETTGAATILIGKDTIILKANSRFSALSGFSIDELEGKKSWTEFVVPEDLERMKQLHRQRRDDPSHEVRIYEFRFINRHGEIRQCINNVRVIPGTTNSVASVVDISVRKRAEEELQAAYEQLTSTEEQLRAQYEELKNTEAALRNSERSLQGIVQGSSIPQFVIDKNHRVISWNNALEQYSGVKAGEVLGTNQQWKAFYPEERPCMADLLVDGTLDKIPDWYPGKFNKSKYVEGAFEATDFFPNMGDHGTWLYFTASALMDSQGMIIGAVETLEDITEIKKDEEAIRVSEAKYRTILENIQDVYYRGDTDGNLILASPSMATVLGYDSISELYGKNIARTLYYLPEERTQFLEEINRSGSVTNYEVTLTKRDGTPVIVLTSSHKYYDESGTFMGVEGIFRDITERRRSEDELRRAYEQITASEEELRAQFEELKYGQDALCTSERKLQGIVQGSPIPQFVIDKNHRVISWNHALEQYSGVEASEVIGTNQQWKAFYPEERPCMADLLVDGTLDKIPDWYPGKYNRSKYVDGAYEATDFFPNMGEHGIWLYFTASVLRDSQGVIIGAVETLEDITEEKKGEEELRQSEAQYRSILENIQDVFYRSDSKGNLIMMSPSGASLLGYDSPDDLIGMSIAGQIYANPEDRTAFLDAMKEKSFVQNYPVNLLRKDGSVVTVSTNSHYYSLPDGSIGGVEGIFRDITGIKHAEKMLQESEALYRTIFNNTGAATIIIAPDTTILLANDGWEALTGIPKDRQENVMSWTAFINKDDVDRMKQYHYARRKDPTLAPRIYECRLNDAAGNVHNCVVNVLMIPGTSNSVASLVDITDLKHTEEALRQINKKLNLMSSVTRHDIINQLTALGGFTELLKTNLSSPRAFEYISQSEAAIRNIERQITFTGLYQDIGVNSPQWQNVAESIRQAESQGIDGKTLIENDLNTIEIYADPLLVKVFYNLLDNSIRHGEKVTQIRFFSTHAPSGLVIICEDDGAGIPCEEKERIFERGFGRHTGFGLFLAREILSITGLSIRETGEPGRGACFEIHIPAGAFRQMP
ncbi:MAG: PAS domain S-box protein [Methanoregula sp.]